MKQWSDRFGVPMFCQIHGRRLGHWYANNLTRSPKGFQDYADKRFISNKGANMKKSNAVENLALSFIAVGLTPESLRTLWQSYSLRLAVDKKAGMSIVLWNTRIAAVKLALKMREINV